jgi:hypothetical protein
VKRAGIEGVKMPVGTSGADALGGEFRAPMQFSPKQPEVPGSWQVSTQELRFDVDGILGWYNVMRHNVIGIEWELRVVAPLPESTPPPKDFVVFKFDPEGVVLLIDDVSLEIGGLKERVRVLIDSGDPDGLALDDGLWDRIQGDAKGRPCSLSRSWSSVTGSMIERAYVFDKVGLFDMPLKGVTVERAGRKAAMDPQGKQTPTVRMGLAALSHFAVGIHGPRGELWLKPRDTPGVKQDINLSGLLLKSRADNEDPVVAVVDDGSKAWNMGFRADDEIIEVNGKSVLAADAQREDMPRISFTRLIDSSAPLAVKVRRDGKFVDLERK